ncbi:unnamed protein product, partial [Prorocentrum cordatum]
RSAGSMGPRLPPGPPPERLLRRAAAASAATGAPRQGADAAATPPPSTKQIEAFASRSGPPGAPRTKLALAKVSADMRRHVIDSFTFRPVAGQSPDAALEQCCGSWGRSASRACGPPFCASGATGGVRAHALAAMALASLDAAQVKIAFATWHFAQSCAPFPAPHPPQPHSPSIVS